MTLHTSVARRRRAPLLASLTIALGIGAGLLVAEALVRVFFRYNNPDVVRAHSLQYLPSIFARHRLLPNQSVRIDAAWGDPAEARPKDRLYVINEQGYRGRPIAVPKPNGVTRIVILGGSSVFDANATEGSDWPHLVQEDLRRMGHDQVEVINAGIPGHASFDSLGRLYSQIWMFQPDYVLIYHGWNDIKYLTKLAPQTPLLAAIPTYDPGADPFQNYQGRLDRLLSHSQVYVKLRNQYLIRKLEPGPEGARPESTPRQTYGEWGLRQFRLDLELLVDASRDIGATPVLVTEATLVAAQNGPADRARIGYDYQGMDHETLVRAYEDCYRIIEEVGQAKKVKVLEAAAKLNGRSELFEDHVHTTTRGSEAIAAEVAGFLASDLPR